MTSVLSSLVVLCCFGTSRYVYAKYTLNYARLCNETSLCKFYSSVKNIGEEQYLNANYTCPVPLGDNLRATADIDLKVGNKFKHLFRISENNACFGLMNYLGPLFGDIMRATGRSLSAPCPIPEKVKIHLNNYKLDLTKIKLQSFPFGTIRIALRTIQKSTEKEVICLYIELLSARP